MNYTLRLSLLCIFCLASLQNLYAQSESTPILFIYDASGSMWGQMGNKTKMTIASEVLTETVSKMNEQQSIGLMAYGHRRKRDCEDIEILVKLDNTSKEKIIESVSAIKPVGRTPLARSARLAIDQLVRNKQKATIILITDGIESCDGDICELISRAKAEGVEFRLHIVGFGLKDENTEQLKCAANAGNGQYFEADNAEGLGEVLNEAVKETVEELEENVSLYATKNGEPIDAWIRAKATDKQKYEGLSRTYRDTAFMFLAPGKYDLVIDPLEGTDISAREMIITITKGDFKHYDVSFDGSKLEVFASNNGEGTDATVRIYNVETGKLAATTRTYGREQLVELDPGNYRIEYKALKIEGTETEYEIQDIKIDAGESLKRTHDFESGYAFIGAQTKSGELIDATVNIKHIETGQSVAGARTYTSSSSNPKRFNLNPGRYTVKMNTLGKHKGNSISFDIEILKEKETRIIKEF